MLRILVIILAFPLAFFAMACKERLDKSRPVRAVVLKLLPLREGQAPSTTPQSIVSEESFFSLRDIDSMEGDFFEILEDGELTIVEDSLSESGSTLSGFRGGKAPKIRYRVKNGTAIPLDYHSFWILSCYYQFDYMFGILEKLTGISPQTIKNKFGKIKIWINPQIKLSNSDYSYTGVEKTNAAYFSARQQFLILKHSKMESTPIANNLQIIVHEVAHFLFELILGGHLKGDLTKNDNVILRGVNEGFADFVSYVVTGSTDILTASFSDFKSLRRPEHRNFSNISFSWNILYIRSDFKKIHTTDACHGGFYCLGSILAKNLFILASQLGVDPRSFEERVKFLKFLLSSWDNLIKDLPKEKEKELQGAQFFNVFLNQSKERFLKNSSEYFPGRSFLNFPEESFSPQ